MFLSIRDFWQRLLCAALLSMCTAQLIATEVQEFDLDEGYAEHTLKQFGRQAQIGILFNPSIVSGVQTSEVVGEFVPRDALERMLKGTPLVFNQDLETGSFAVTRSEEPFANLTTTSSEPKLVKDTEMKVKKDSWLKILTTVLTLGVVGAPSKVVSQEQSETENVYDLNPFTISESEDIGYLATSTLAGTRIKSDLRDVGASIAVVTKEFMEDIGATDGQSLLQFVGNVEVGGVLGNYSDVDTGFASTNDSRLNPQSGQRVRGLVSATLTRDYFQTIIPFEGYNTSRVSVNRGPNSILFGLGSPGGVVNSNTHKAVKGNDFGSVSVRFDSRNGHRETLDYNKTLIEDRLVIRVSLLNKKVNYKQEPAFDDDRRFFIAWDATLFKNQNSDILGKTTFRGSFEHGEIYRNPPDVVPPTDAYSSWWNGIGSQEDLNRILSVPGVDLSDISNAAVTKQQVLSAIDAGLVTVPEGMAADDYAAVEGQFIPKTTINRFNRAGRNNTRHRSPYFLYPAINYNSVTATEPGWNAPELAGIQGIMARWRNGATKDLKWTTTATGGAGFIAPSINNRDVFDYHNLLFQGTSNFVDDDFEIQQYFLEQELFGGNAGIEIAYDTQRRDRINYTPFSSNNEKRISIEITEHHAPGDFDFDGIADGFENENLGRPVIDRDTNETTFERREQDTFRATVFGTFNVNDYNDGLLGNILGSHTLTGLYEKRTNDFVTRGTVGAWWADSGDHPGESFISNGDNDSSRRIVTSQIFLGPDARGLSSPDDLRIDGYIDVQFPRVGEEYGIWYYDNRGSVEAGATNTWRIIEGVRSAGISRSQLESKAFSLQSKLFRGNIVGMYAWRDDEQTTWRRLDHTGARGPSGSGALRLDNPGINETDGNWNEADLLRLGPPSDPDSDETTTWSVVGHYPEEQLGELPFGMDVSFHYYEAESFEPASGQVNIYNEPLSSPFGTTKEYGATLSFLDNQLSVRLNWFDTSNAFARTDLGGQLDDVVGRVGFFRGRIAQHEEAGFPLYPDGFNGLGVPGTPGTDAALTPDTIPDNRQRTTGTDADLIGVSSYDEYYEDLRTLLPTDFRGRNIREIYGYTVVRNENGTVDFVSTPLDGSLQSTLDFVAEGIEVDIVGQITDSLSISLNVAQQETVTSNTGPEAIPLAFEIMERIKEVTPKRPWGFYPLRDSPFQGETGAVGATRYENVLRILREEAAKDNTVSQEQREWRVNLVTRYDFQESLLKGFGIGAALRYQDEIAAGYPNKWNEDGDAVPDILNPWFGPDELNGDLFFRYRRKLTERIEWSVQLNMRNLYRKNGNDDIPVTINPDGTTALIRIPNEQQFFLTNTFKF